MIDISIGIASGMACVGNIGSRDRFDYSVIGETVNIAARVESASRDIGFDIVMLHSPERPTPNARLSAGTYLLKGISDVVQIDILVGDHSIAESAQFHAVKQAHSGLLAGAQKGMADRDQLAKAKNLADALDPSLDVFYRRLEHHLDQGRKTIQ